MVKFILSIVGFLIVVFGLYQIWNLSVKLQTLTPQKSSESSSVSENDQDLKEIKDESLNLSFKIPSSWNSYSNKSVSQFPTPLKITEGSVYNLITYEKTNKPILRGHYNGDLIKTLFEFKDNQELIDDKQGPDRVKLTKLSGGKIKSGQKYAVIRTEFLGKADIKGYISLGVSDLLIFSLTHYDDNGLAAFKEMVQSASL